MVTLKDILDDILASYPFDVKDFDPKVLNDFINEGYIEVRNQFIENGQSEQFAITRFVTGFSEYHRVPYLWQGKLKDPILQQRPLDDVVVYVICRTGKELRNREQSWEAGDKVFKGNDAFVALSEVPLMNSFDLTFQNCDVRNYHPNNRLRYKKGDVVYENDIPYRATETTLNDSDTPLEDRPEWERVYWLYAGVGFIRPQVVDFKQMDRKRAAIDGGFTILTIDRENVYVSKGVTQVELSYIPIHTFKYRNDDKFHVPDSAIPFWKQSVHQKMSISRGQMVESNE